MRVKLDQTLATLLTQRLCDRRNPRPLSLSKRDCAELLTRLGWNERNEQIRAQLDGFTWQQALDLSRDTMEHLSGEPRGGWLNYTYRYLLDMAFPDPDFSALREKYGSGAIFLATLMQLIYDVQRNEGLLPGSLDIRLLSKPQFEGEDTAGEYQRLLRVIRREFVYEMMRLSQELTPFKTLEHITGVHKVAISTGRELKQSGAPVDLALVSGAAAVHDLGKFGCKPGERVPYLHYYYTEQWCRNRRMPTIGHIAANHSVWDLGIENLSAESLLLIYADFRVKQERDLDGQERTTLYSLQESFDVILSKLDNVDESKRERYRFVYAKLQDFEEYMASRGVDVALSGQGCPQKPQRTAALLSDVELVSALKLLGVEHNIELMHRLTAEHLFGNVLEAARSEKKWKNIRAYLGVFEEYFTYLNSEQKAQTLAFLYELLMNKEGDIRRQAAVLLGNIIARFDLTYKKELPAHVVREEELTARKLWSKYLRMIVFPDHKLTPQHKHWIGYTMKIVISSCFNHCAPQDRRPFLQDVLTYYRSAGQMEDETALVLTDAMHYLPCEDCTESEVQMLCDMALNMYERPVLSLQAAALRALRRLAERVPLSSTCKAEIERKTSTILSEGHELTFLRGRLLRALGVAGAGAEQLSDLQVSSMFLNNLKMATPWLIKEVNIRVLTDFAKTHPDSPYLMHIAAHFSNLLKVSERVAVRHDAGTALLEITSLLTLDQRNEIAVELTKGLDVGNYEFSKYVPEYLGRFLLWLAPRELDERIRQLKELSTSPNANIVSVALSTIGVTLEYYHVYPSRFPQDESFAIRQEHLLGLLFKGLAGYRSAVQQEAMLVIGQHLFASNNIQEEEKRLIFSKCGKKLLELLLDSQDSELTFFYRAAALNHIYRFITAASLHGTSLTIDRWPNVAFFPGTFDPFTSSHKAIVEHICGLGFEVMLSIDEFSWSKKTQPHLIRQRIAMMSVADQFHVHVFPDSIPVNIANPEDLRRLRLALPGRNIYMVVGSDVIANASSYQAEVEPDSIHTFDHIVFRRAETVKEQSDAGPNLKRIQGQVITLSLPVHLEDVSSSRIRDNIDNDRDISNLIDPVAQEYIYHNNLYLREPQYKEVMDDLDYRFYHYAHPTENELRRLEKEWRLGEELHKFSNENQKNKTEYLQVITLSKGRPLGLIYWYELPMRELLPYLKDPLLTDHVRQHRASKVALLAGVSLRDSDDAGTAQLLLTEALSEALRRDCTHALFPADTTKASPTILKVLERQGFQVLDGSPPQRPLYITDMGSVVVLIRNIETAFKEPFSRLPSVLRMAAQCHWRLQKAMTHLFPGELILSIDANVMNQKLIEQITQINGVPSQPTTPRKLGPLMCVPFGKLLRGKVIPNTVTKTLHTDKVFDPDIRHFSVEAYPGFSSLRTQMKVIKSFRRPAIMVHDLLHSSHRMQTLSPLCAEEGVDIHTVLVGVISGRGQDLMIQQGHHAKGVYFVPNLRAWCVESTVYPFIGGDTVRRPGPTIANLLPSVNLILPYASIRIFNQCDRKAVFDYSLTCLENARDLLTVLETEYRDRFGRNLTLNRLAEVVNLPLCPDKGPSINYDYNLTASGYVQNDIEMLQRIQDQFLRDK